MRILRGIRMMMVRLITRATCHCEVRATCFSEGGVPTEMNQTLKLTYSSTNNEANFKAFLVGWKLVGNVFSLP